MTLNVVELKRPDYFDVVKSLRNLADELEIGSLGEARTCVVCLGMADELHVFGSGPASDLAMVYLTLGRAKAIIDSDDYEVIE